MRLVFPRPVAVLAGLVFAAACAATHVRLPHAIPGALAAPEPLAAREGARILRAGGNAADAAVCIGFVLAVTHPEAGNLGGGGFLVVHANGEDLVIDARETAPGRAHRSMYVDAHGAPRPGASLIGPLAAGTPGSVAGYLLLHERFGSLPLPRLIEPAIRLAERGFRVDGGLHESFARHRGLLARFPETAAIFLPEGKVPEEGERLRQPALARVLRAIAEHGRAGFYGGRFARAVEVASRRHGGLLTSADLRGYQAKVREPLRGSYRGRTVVTMPPPSSGGVVLLQILGMLQEIGIDDMRAEQRRHVFAEVSKRAFADRARYFGDPDFVDVPVRDLLAPAYLARRARGIRMDASTPSREIDGGLGPRPESGQTCHFSVLDGAGNAVSCTTTLNGAFGCGLAVSGVLLNNEMDDFTVKPGEPNQFGLIQSGKNAIEPGKRPLSSMTPTILLDARGEPCLVLGSPGGPTIISTVAQVIVARIVDGAALRDAIAAPRIHHQWWPDEIVHEPLPGAQERALRALGHTLRLRERPLGDVQAVGRDPDGQLVAASDPRGRGAAIR